MPCRSVLGSSPMSVACLAELSSELATGSSVISTPAKARSITAGFSPLPVSRTSGDDRGDGAHRGTGPASVPGVVVDHDALATMPAPAVVPAWWRERHDRL